MKALCDWTSHSIDLLGAVGGNLSGMAGGPGCYFQVILVPVEDGR